MKVTIAQLEKVYLAVVVYLNGTCQCDCEDCADFHNSIATIREEQGALDENKPNR